MPMNHLVPKTLIIEYIIKKVLFKRKKDKKIY